MRYFTQDLPASKLAALSDVSRPTINQRFFKLRPRIAQLCDASSPFSGEVEVDESSFGTRRVRGKKGRGARGKTIVFGILEWQGKGLHGNRPECLQEAATGRDSGPGTLDSIIHSDGWRGYNGLVDMGYQKHLRVHP